MNIQQIKNSQNFEGKLVIVNELSKKPKRCISKVQGYIQKLVKSKDYNLFIQQDYSKNEMRIIADYSFPLKPSQRMYLFSRTQMNIPVTSKASKYVEASKDVIDMHEKALSDIEQKNWELKQKQRKKDEILETIEAILYVPVLIIDAVLNSINPKSGAKFEKILDKLGI